MDEIIRVKNISYSRYEELLMRRDKVKKEAFQWGREYVRVFGDTILKIFELKLTCIRKKKTISFCQAVANRGGKINQQELQEYLEQEMSAYQEQLDAMIKDNNAAKETSQLTQMEILEVKKIYHRLAKQLHPDINPMTAKNEKLKDIWQRIAIAYNCNNLKDMKELEILATSALKELGTGKIEIEIPDIDEKIAEVEAEINKIRDTDPYMYKFLLENPEMVKAKNKSLDEELKEYEEYEKQLDEILQGLMVSGVKFTWRMN